MRLDVVIPMVRPSEGGRCCGLRGAKWKHLLRAAFDDEAEHARRLLSESGTKHSVTVAEGDSVPEIVSAFSAAEERVLALPARVAGTPFTRGSLRRTERLSAGRVRLLPAH